ncbi:folate-binding protein YgfZ [Haloferula luteola]|uniref:Folate-binding protein YgfZ n=1 Tax=Haloferula luteola TaxID=595692 RepID=A0A840UZ39_9BACT|nr:hypothetical protein [Haloferula luteola]MBB5351042.1 folate-binding protein YgfZ [Haloferula luteola]
MESFPLETPGLIEVRGPDAVRFLNGQITQDARNLGDATRASCITDAKGRLQFYVEILQSPKADPCLWVATRFDEREEILARLDRYLIADDASLEDLSGSWHRLRADSPGLPDANFSRTSTWPEPNWRDYWFDFLPTSPAPAPLSPTEIEERRIRLGSPIWGREITAGLLPPEARLDTSAISFSKGCYIGQETLSRIKSAGKLNRKLAPFQVLGFLAAGDTFESDGIPCGTITSVAPSGQYALGFLHKSGFGKSHFTVTERPASQLTLKEKA